MKEWKVNGKKEHGFVSRLYHVDQTEQREFTIIVNSENNCTKGRRTKR